MSDFVDIIARLTAFVQNERIASYNEAVDMMLDNVRGWMRLEGMTPKGNELSELLDEISAHLSGVVGSPKQRGGKDA